MEIFALDTETTITNKGDPFDPRNNFVLGGYGTSNGCQYFIGIENRILQTCLDNAKLVILFNAKFDLHWLRRIGIRFGIRLPIWDCQLAEFILSNQQWKYPSLEEACSKRGIGHKIDIIKEEYWNKGIDTDKIPPAILNEYLTQDVSLTYQLYQAQKKDFQTAEHQSKYKLFRLGCYDLMVLEEMEYNGYKFDVHAAREEATKLEKDSTDIDISITSLFPDVPINLASNDHISAILYGGTITEEKRIPVGVYKTGDKTGQPRYRLEEFKYNLPRLVEPIKGSELAKEGYWGTGEDVLRNLEAKGKVKTIIDNLLARRGIEKLRGTYYNGIPDLIEEHQWAGNIVHGQLNQVVARSGRLSATKPNQQNMPGSCKRFCVSRYEN